MTPEQTKLVRQSFDAIWPVRRKLADQFYRRFFELAPDAQGHSAGLRPKKVENHAHSVALFAMYYNFVRIHKTLRTTPAMAANITKRLWEIGDIVDVLEAWETAQKAA